MELKGFKIDVPIHGSLIYAKLQSIERKNGLLTNDVGSLDVVSVRFQ